MISFAYLRKSRDRREQTDPEVLARHRAILCNLLASNGDEAQFFEDVGSGERIASRPSFQRLLQALTALPDVPRATVGAHLYVIDADRISRGILTERGQIQDLLIAKGVVICTPQGVTDLRDTDQRLLHNVKGALAEWELGKYKDRVARTRRDQIRQGQARNANVPWGYEWDHKHKRPVPHRDRFPILQAAAREAMHTSLHVLARKYQVPVVYLWRALRNPLICGWPAQIARIGPNGETIRLPREEWIWPEKEGDYPKACSREDWERLQESLQSRQRGQGGRSDTNHWCRDVVRLNGQACRLSVSWWPIYLARDSRLYIKREEVHRAVEARLAELFRTGDVVSRVAALARRKPEPAPDPGRLEELRAELVALERRAALLEGERLLAVEQAAKAVEREIEGEKRRLERDRRQAPLLSGEEARLLQEVCTELQEGFAEWWDGFLSDVQKRVIVRLLVERAEVECEKVGGRWQRVTVVYLKSWLEEPTSSSV